MHRSFLLICITLAAAFAQAEHPTLAIGSPAPDFSLPGIDGKTHTLAEYSASPILAIVFTCNHCPTAQLYEGRIKKLVEDYRAKGVKLIAIEPNDPNGDPPQRIGLHGCQRQLRRDEDPRRVSSFQFPLSLRRRDAVGVQRLRARRPRRTCSSSTSTASCATKAASTIPSANRW